MNNNNNDIYTSETLSAPCSFLATIARKDTALITLYFQKLTTTFVYHALPITVQQHTITTSSTIDAYKYFYKWLGAAVGRQ